METKKQLIVNSDICDARKVKEDSFREYEKILINADILAVSEKSREELGRLPVLFHGDRVMEVSEDVEFVVNNGDFEIWPQMRPDKRFIMVVNGNLTVHSGAGESLTGYEQIVVNGNLYCPREEMHAAGRFLVNGKRVYYPGNCIVLADAFSVDRYFALRASKGAEYFAADNVRLTDPDVDVTGLKEKEVRFVTEVFTVREEQLKEALSLVDETTKLRVIPQGYAYIGESVCLNEELLQQGDKTVY